jgi:hypothetical protein
MISRDWHCLNGKCGHEFHSYSDANPPCPVCGCVRVSWVPGGGHISGLAPRVDARLRSIADQHGFTNLNSASPSRLNRAAPRVETPPISQEYGIRNFGPGFSAPVAKDGCICVPSVAPVDIRGKVQIGVKRDTSTSIPGPARNATVVARSKQRTI